MISIFSWGVVLSNSSGWREGRADPLNEEIRLLYSHCLVNGSACASTCNSNQPLAPGLYRAHIVARIWPFLQILVAADEDDLEAWATRDFGTDRQQRPKGVLEVLL